MTEPRQIITAKSLIKIFGHHEYQMLCYILGGFILATDQDGLAYYESRIQLTENGPDEPGKKGLVEAWAHLKNAHQNMSKIERANVRKDLVIELLKLGVPK